MVYFTKKLSSVSPSDRVVVELYSLILSIGDNVSGRAKSLFDLDDRPMGSCGLEHIRVDYRSVGVYCYKFHLYGHISQELEDMEK